MKTQDRLLERLSIPKGSRIIDIGFGSTAELTDLSNIVDETGMVIGVERSERRVGKIRFEPAGKKNIQILVGDARRIPVPNGSVDLVLFKGVVHEVPDIQRAFREAKRVCVRGGRIIVVDFSPFPRAWLRGSNFKWRLHHPWTILRSPPDRHPGFSKEQILSFFQEAALTEVRFEDNFAEGIFYGHHVPMFLATSTMQV